MNYQLVNEGTKNSIRLQSVGVVKGSPASEIKKGHVLMWNFGSTESVVDIIKETPKTILISIKSDCNGNLYERRLKKDKIVCILSN